MVSRTVVAALLLLLVGCASGGAAGPTGGDRNLITAEEIAAVSAATAADLVNQLRPNWLRARGPVSMGRNVPDVPIVYVDGVRSGDISVLDRISSQVVTGMRFLPGRDATTMYGLDHGGGVIMVSTRP